jgi:hypothetical protein
MPAPPRFEKVAEMPVQGASGVQVVLTFDWRMLNVPPVAPVRLRKPEMLNSPSPAAVTEQPTPAPPCWVESPSLTGLVGMGGSNAGLPNSPMLKSPPACPTPVPSGRRSRSMRSAPAGSIVRSSYSRGCS